MKTLAFLALAAAPFLFAACHDDDHRHHGDRRAYHGDRVVVEDRGYHHGDNYRRGTSDVVVERSDRRVYAY